MAAGLRGPAADSVRRPVVRTLNIDQNIGKGWSAVGTGIFFATQLSRLSRTLNGLAYFFHFPLRVAPSGSGFVARKEFTAEGDSGSVGAETDPLAV